MRQKIVCTLLIALAGALILAGCSGPATKEQILPMGEKVYVGRLVYTVFETQWMTQLGQGLEARVPQNRYLVLRISVANSGTQSFVVPPVTIEGDDGKVISELQDGKGVPQWIGFLRQARPAEAVQGNIAFDAPPAHYKIRVSDENEVQSAIIDMPLTFNAETPEFNVPGAGSGIGTVPAAR